MHLRLLSDIEREGERERERESTACSIASNDWSRRRLCSTLLIGVQVEPCIINTDRLGHHKKCPYLRGVHINLSGPCYVNYVNLKIHHVLEQNTGGIRDEPERAEKIESNETGHYQTLTSSNLISLAYPMPLLCSWKHALISLIKVALISLKVTHLYVENRVHCMTKLIGH